MNLMLGPNRRKQRVERCAPSISSEGQSDAMKAATMVTATRAFSITCMYGGERFTTQDKRIEAALLPIGQSRQRN